jgi:hypothetical protein
MRLHQKGTFSICALDPSAEEVGLAGETEEALGNLAGSLELELGRRAGAAADADFDAVRQDPRFAALVR